MALIILLCMKLTTMVPGTCKFCNKVFFDMTIAVNKSLIVDEGTLAYFKNIIYLLPSKIVRFDEIKI